MKISILIRSYNRPNYLIKTLKSLFKSDLTNVNNIYIYDDNSNDKRTINILNNIKYKKNIKIIKGKKYMVLIMHIHMMYLHHIFFFLY